MITKVMTHKGTGQLNGLLTKMPGKSPKRSGVIWLYVQCWCDTLAAMKKRTVAEIIEEYRHAPEFMFVEKADVDARGMTGDTFLHAAVVRNRADDVEVLIESGADVNAVGDLGNTPLHEASSRGLRDIVLKLLECGARKNVKNEFGETPADLAVLMGHRDLAGSLKPNEC